MPIDITPPAVGSTGWGPVLNAQLEALETAVNDKLDSVAASSTYQSAVIAAGTGIDPTGATDSTAALNTLIASASADGLAAGSMVRVAFPAGVYLVDGLLAKPNVWLDFGSAYFKKRINGSGDPGSQSINSMLRAVPVLSGSTYYGTYKNIKVTGGTFDPNGMTCPSHIINLVYCEDLEMTGVKVIHDPAALTWAFCLGGRRLTLTDLHVRDGSAVFQDGLHILHGQDITINGGHFASGDDAIALGAEPTDEYLAVDPDPIRRVTINGATVNSSHAHGLRIYVQPTANGTLWEVTDVTVNGLTGQAGVNRNGGIAVSGHLSTVDSDFMVKRITLNAITLDVGSAAHDDVNSYGFFAESVSGMSITDLRQQITEGSAAVAGFDFIKIRSCEDIKLVRPYHRKALPRRFGIDARDSARVSVEQPSLRCGTATITPVYFDDVTDAKVLGGEITDVRSGGTGINATAGTTTTLTVRGTSISHVVGAASGYAVAVTSAAVPHLTLEGNDLSGAFAPVALTVLRSLTSAIVKGNRGLVDLTVPNDRPFSTVAAGRGRLDAVVAQTYTLSEGGQAAPAGSLGGLGVFYLNPADYPTGGKLRLRHVIVPNSTASGSTFTAGLYPVTASSGAAAAVSATLGTVVAGSTAAIAAPAALVPASATSGEFDCPAAGFYTLAVVITTNMAASSAVVTRGTLEARAA